MRINAVLFDLDGTLTVPYLDFDAIRTEIGDVQGPILEAMAHMTPAELRRTEDILARHELDAAENSSLNPGAAELLAELHRQGRGIGIITRNCHDSVNRIRELHSLHFDAVVTREDGPVKPDPFGVHRLCEMLTVDPRNTCLVGDYVFDLQAARNADAASVLIATSDKYQEFLDHADYVIHSLPELHDVIAAFEANHDTPATTQEPRL